jgi:hypothetical protein
VEAIQEPMHGVRGQIGYVAEVTAGIVKRRDIRHPPPDVGPPAAVMRAVRIAVIVGVLMMRAMDRYPL